MAVVRKFAVRKFVVGCACVAMVGLGGACTSNAAGDGGTTTTIRNLTTGRIDGITENRFCGGPVSPSGCQSSYVAQSDRVEVVPHIPAVDPFLIDSGPDGTFSVNLIAGEWELTAAPTSAGGSTDCPSVTVTVVAGTTTPVTLQCTIELP
jgi:hypothetical protein